MYRQEIDNRFQDVYSQHGMPPGQMQGGAGFGKFLRGAQKFAKSTGIISKGLAFAGHPELAGIASLAGYGGYPTSQYQGSGIVGGVAPQFRSQYKNAAPGTPVGYYKDGTVKRKGFHKDGTPRELSAWQEFVRMNYQETRQDIIEALSAQSAQEDFRLLGHSPPNGRDVNSLTFQSLAGGFALVHPRTPEQQRKYEENKMRRQAKRNPMGYSTSSQYSGPVRYGPPRR